MIMGVDSYDELLDKVNSKNAESIEFEVDGYSVYVRIPGTDIETHR